MGWTRLAKNALLTLTAVTLCASFFLLGQHFPSHDGGHGAGGEHGGGGQRMVASRPGPGGETTFEKRYCSVDRVKTHVSTDKPLYRPGETVRIRGVQLAAADLSPFGLARGQQQNHRPQPFVSLRVTVKGPKGDTVATIGQVTTQDAVAAASWVVPRGLPGGEHTVHFDFDTDGFAPAQRTFSVREFSAPSMRLQMRFARDGYGPGDTVTAHVQALRLDGGAAAGASVTGIARLDGHEVWRGDGSTTVSGAGEASVSFKLPAKIARGEGSLNLVVRDGAVSASLAKTLPVLLADVDLQVMPEGGELVAGLPTRVYFEASTPYGEPADIEAEVMAVSGGGGDAGLRKRAVKVGTVKTTHEGRGVSSVFVPRAGVSYELRVTHPASVRQSKPLPAVRTSGGGTVMATPMTGGIAVADPSEPIRVSVGAAAAGSYRVGLYRREAELASHVLDLPGVEAAAAAAAAADVKADVEAAMSGMRTVLLTPPRTSNADGVLRVTLFEAGSDTPVAERLVFRRPGATLKLAVSAARQPAEYGPGETVTLTVRATDDAGEPAAGAVVGLTVTDDSVLQMVERRRQAPRLPAMALLEDEVKAEALVDADKYMADIYPPTHGEDEGEGGDKDKDKDARSGGSSGTSSGSRGGVASEAKPATALDLLLGTQGWRRFAYRDALAFIGPAPWEVRQHEQQLQRDRARGPEADRPLGERFERKRRDGGGRRGGGSEGPYPWPDGTTPAGEPATEPKEAKEYAIAERLLGVHRAERMHMLQPHPEMLMMRAGAAPGVGGMAFMHNAEAMDGAAPPGAAVMAMAGAMREAVADAPVMMRAAAPMAAGAMPDAMPEAVAMPAMARVDDAGAANGAGVKMFGEAGGAAVPQMAPAPPMDMDMGMDMGMPGVGVDLADAAGDVAMDEGQGAPEPMPMGEPGFVGGAPPMQPMPMPPMAPPMMAKRMQRPHMPYMPHMRVVRVYAHSRRKPAAGAAAPAGMAARTDFTETVFWAAGLVADDEGVVTAKFELSDSITTLRVLVDGFAAVHGPHAALGCASATLTSVEPLYATLRLPTEVTAGDRMSVKVAAVIAAAAAARDGYSVALTAGVQGPVRLLATADAEAGTGEAQSVHKWKQAARSHSQYLHAIAVPPSPPSDGASNDNGNSDGDGQSSPPPPEPPVDIMPMPVPVPLAGPGGDGDGASPSQADPSTAVWTVSAAAQGGDRELVDTQVRPMRVKAGGFPVEVDAGGMLGVGEAGAAPAGDGFLVQLPSQLVAGSLSARVQAFPSPVASLTAALEALIQMPCGCFEQTSATTYPLVMAQQYFKTHAGVDPSLVARSHAMLAEGYKKLTSFESEGGGFEWFGAAPGHEALTAYGALQFQDMASVFDVDSDLLARTRKWLLGRRDGKGGFKRNPRSLDSFGRASDEITNAYIVWALASAGESSESLKAEVQALLREADAATDAVGDADSAAYARDPYFVGLVAGALYAVGDKANADRLAERLAQLATATGEGYLEGASTSITCSGGDALRVETTAVAVLAWLRNDDKFAAHTEAAMKWLVGRCQGGRFGSTQATVLALKAIIAYDVARAAPKGEGDITLTVDGASVATVHFDADSKGALSFDGDRVAAALLQGAAAGKGKGEGEGEPSQHRLQLRMEGSDAEATMPFSMHVEYSTHLPPSGVEAPVLLKTSLTDADVAAGEVTELRVSVTNARDEPAPMTVAVVGVPGGLEVRHERLRELVKAGTIAFYEVRGRDLVLYWRGMAPAQTVELQVDLAAAVAGTYTGDASRAYLYYTEELKSWQAGLQVTVREEAI